VLLCVTEQHLSLPCAPSHLFPSSFCSCAPLLFTGTSKINYMDPRITASWCKAVGLPIEKVFNQALIKKFPWASEWASEQILGDCCSLSLSRTRLTLLSLPPPPFLLQWMWTRTSSSE
jgi:hypothetical protein